MTSPSALAKNWQSAGIEHGDTVLLHSSAKRSLNRLREGDAAAGVTELLASFLEAVGPAGTLLCPLFNFEFTEGVPFDIRTTPSHMGALSEAARTYPGAVRTGHPIYSFAVIGAEAEHFAGIDNTSGYGADSPFALLRELDGKIAVLDLDDQNSMTMYHHVEEMHEVDYRYHKQFEGPYTDANGVTANRTYSLFVRNIERGVQTDVNRAGELLWQRGLYSGDRPKEGAGLRVIDAGRFFDAVSEIIVDGKAVDYLYSIEAS